MGNHIQEGPGARQCVIREPVRMTGGRNRLTRTSGRADRAVVGGEQPRAQRLTYRDLGHLLRGTPPLAS